MSATSRAAPLTWYVRVDEPLTGAENMAWDHTLARSCGPGTAILRLYGWDRPTLSFGRNEPARGLYLPEVLDEAGVAVVRRPTGGRAVLHDRELTYSVVAPIRPLGGVRSAYAAVNRALAAGLGRLIAADTVLDREIALAGPGPAARPDAGPCFQAPAEGEVMAMGRKLVGSAQLRIGEVLLQHGSILLEDDQSTISSLRAGPADPDDNTPAALNTVLGRKTELSEVRRAVIEGFRHTLAGDWRGSEDGGRLDLHGLPPLPATDLLEQYRSAEWTWRR